MTDSAHESESQPGIWSPHFPFSPARKPLFYGWVMVAAGPLGIEFSIPGQTMGFSVFSDILIRERNWLSFTHLLVTYYDQHCDLKDSCQTQFWSSATR